MENKMVFRIAVLFTALLMQGCGGFKAVSKSSDYASLDTGELRVLTRSPQAGSAIQVEVGLGQVLDQGSSILWDHEFGDGSTFCQQTTSLDKSQTTFLCPTSGTLKVIVTLIHASGEEESWSTQIEVREAGVAPTPSPTPTQVTGVQLYNQHCSGCHGPLATSTKRNRTLIQLNGAIATVSGMESLSTLSQADRQLIIEALH